MGLDKMFQRHFEYHGGEYPRQRHYECQQTLNLEEECSFCHWCQIRSFSTHAEHPIAIVNEVDRAVLPSNFKFIENSILREGVDSADEEFRTGCECTNDRDCQRRGCHCLQDMAIDEDDMEDGGDVDEKIAIYHGTGNRKECLRGEVLESRQPIYECHTSCACSQDCKNRVVERGRMIPLQIFRTKNGRGWGVRSPVSIKRGQYVDKYVGEILTSSAADQRRADSDVAQRKDVYLFALDKFSDPDSRDDRLSGPPFEVDGEFFSGPTRFINHSCEPNLRSFARVGDHADKHLHDLALFAIEDIAAGEELTFDYVNGEETDLLEDSLDPSKIKDMARCLCGSQNCRGFLW